jgi:hypothetical protein
MGAVNKLVLIFGSEKAFASARGTALKTYLESKNLQVFSCATPILLKEYMAKNKATFEAAFLVVDGAPPPLAAWQAQLYAMQPKPDVYVVAETAPQEAYLKLIGAVRVLSPSDSFSLLDSIFEGSLLADIAAAPAPSPAPALELAPEPNNDATVIMGMTDNIDLAAAANGTQPKIKMNSEMPAPDAAPVDLDLALDMAPDSSSDATVLIKGAELDVSIEPASSISAVAGDAGAADETVVLGAEESPDLASSTEETSSNKSTSLVPPSTVVGIPGDFQTLKKYTVIKEREVRERDGALQVMTAQLKQIQIKLDKSDKERRRLQIVLEDIESKYRVLETEKDQNNFHLSSIESVHQEKLRDMQLRLDNAQFAAQKAERKLEEFRIKIRSDIHKIRARERELANRLELQKRDAEALLAAKDERLMQQGREIDRLKFELESLRDRIVSDTEKAEDRAGRLMRALQSLKLAQGVLSSIDEEVVPNAGNAKKKGEAA